MRISGPSNSKKSARAGAAGKAKKGKGASFAGKVARAEKADSTEAMARNVRSALLEELLGVAKELAESDDKEATTKHFVSAVIKDRFQGMNSKDAKQVGEAVSDLINQDEDLAQRLHSQLAKLAKS